MVFTSSRLLTKTVRWFSYSFIKVLVRPNASVPRHAHRPISAKDLVSWMTEHGRKTELGKWRRRKEDWEKNQSEYYWPTKRRMGTNTRGHFPWSKKFTERKWYRVWTLRWLCWRAHPSSTSQMEEKLDFCRDCIKGIIFPTIWSYVVFFSSFSFLFNCVNQHWVTLMPALMGGILYNGNESRDSSVEDVDVLLSNTFRQDAPLFQSF